MISAEYLKGELMVKSTVIFSARRQIIRLPKAVAFPGNVQCVDILRIGCSRMIIPHGQRWDDLFLAGPTVTGEFLAEREQPTAETRK